MSFPKSTTSKATKKQTSSSISASFSASVSVRVRSTEVSRRGNSYRDAGPSYDRNLINGYEADGFVVGDDDDEEGEHELPDSYGFMPVRDRSRAARSVGGPTIGEPIRGDPELANLSEYEKDVLGRFMVEAKKLRLRVMRRQGWERIGSVLEDRQIRTIGIKLPTGTF